MPRISADYKPTKAETEAWAKEREARIEIGRQRSLAFQNATQGAADRADKPGCRPSYPMPTKREGRP